MPGDPMKRHVRLRDLDTLLAVVQAGGMRKAAQQLHLSQPAVSKAVRSLEDALGVPLLDRGKRGVEATAFGAALTRRTKAAFDELRLALADIEHLADPEGGEVRFGAMETLCAGVVAVAIEQMARRYPRMRLHVQPGNSANLIGHFLRERLIEFAIVRPRELALPADMVGEPLFVDRFLVVVGHQHPHARRRRIGLAELVQEDWIVSEAESLPQSPLDRAFRAAGTQMPTPRMRSDSINLRLRLLTTGHWVTLMPRAMLRFIPAAGLVRALPIGIPQWEIPNMIVTHRDHTLTVPTAKFLDELKEVARSLG
jgi:DNA-binding transcriptional LysR family regulator